jgi:hypothetical protein
MQASHYQDKKPLYPEVPGLTKSKYQLTAVSRSTWFDKIRQAKIYGLQLSMLILGTEQKVLQCMATTFTQFATSPS